MENLLIGAIVKEVGNDTQLMIIDKISVAYNDTTTSVYLAVNNKGEIKEIEWDEILKVISFKDKSPTPSDFINTKEKES